MTKKNGYLIFFVLVLITKIEYLNSMEQEKKGSKATTALLRISPSSSTETAKAIATDKHADSSEENEKEDQAKAVQKIAFNFPGSSGHAVTDLDESAHLANLALLKVSEHSPSGFPPSES